MAGKGQQQRQQQQPLRILCVSDFFHPNVGGVESHVYELATNLIALGHTVIVYTHAYETKDATYVGRHVLGGPRRPSTQQTKHRGHPPAITVYYVPRLPVYQSATLPTIFGSLYNLRKVIRRERIDLVHAHQAFSAMANESIVHARTMGIPAVFTDHSLFGFADPASILMNKALKFSLADVQRVICVSHTSRENTVLRACVPPSRVYVIPNAVDMDTFYVDDVARLERNGGRAGLEARDRTVVVMSRLVYRKGIDLLVRVIPIVCRQFPDVRFVIGGDGPKRDELERMVEASGLQGRVELAGLVEKEDVRGFLSQGSIFLNCSLTEAFCVALVEAAAVGSLVVSTAVGGVPEVLPEDMMVLAEEASVGGVVKALEKALRMVRDRWHGDTVGARAERMARQHADVVQMYSWRVVATRTERVYYDAIQAARRSTVRQRMARYRLCGKWFGLLCVALAVVDLMLCRVYEWFECVVSVSFSSFVPAGRA